ncbi:MAG: leucyl aminopeptidase [archaeon]
MDSKLVFSDSPKGSLLVHFAFEGAVSHLKGPSYFTGKKLESAFMPEKSFLLVGLGKKEEFNIDYLRRAAAKAVKTASAAKMPIVHFALLDGHKENEMVAVAEGAVLANYSFDKYKTDAEQKMFRIKELSFPVAAKKFEESIRETLLVCQNVFIARDLVTENSDVVTPKMLEEVSRKISGKHIKVRVLNEKQLRRLGFNMLLGVARASEIPPRVIIFEYNGNPSSKDKVMFAGKGVCFDSGGLNIKVGESMKDMRMDMAGAATVIAIMKSASELKLKKNIVGIIGCVENLVDSKSFRPGDVIKSYSGKTVENLNTDAEGRLVLGDILAYGARKYNPNVIVEFSTLTGAILGTFGSHCAGMFSTSDSYSQKMFDAGMATYERVWRLPLFEEYKEETKGERSDLRSIGKTRYNGSIFGGAFLAEFVENIPFIHLDVAGTAMLEEPKDYMPKNGSGFGVRLAIEFLKRV